jgi:hypothetical protein
MPSPARNNDDIEATERDHLIPAAVGPIVEYPQEGADNEFRPRRLAYASLVTLLVCFLALCVVVVLYPPGYMSRNNNSDYYGGLDVDQLQSGKGKKHHHHKKKERSSIISTKPSCNDGGYSKRTLHRAYELPFASLFRDDRGQTKYEASSVIVVDNDVYAVCDSSWAISKFDDSLVPFSPSNVQIGDPNREEEVSLFFV